ncbi:response regulator [Hymenobacter sp. BT770]|uniref:response regulator n=1 Tax=Hymenobacter sp. BT770 TaxID=2886942 RepID=UPI001D11C86B|nr:response regulator [Hymenobacter sp. BT770]MCC3151486.1 response regulator [Hymenobacter sp. BT770]MDO3413938.1 response regulator [Hymenobacter sp. BT770]
MKTYLIDDDQLGIYLTEQLLLAEGFSNSICTFESAEAALQSLAQGEEEMPQVVFLDLNMPVMNGWEFLDALAPYEKKMRGNCHIYILTSSLALTDLEKSKHYDLVVGLIHKPLDSKEIRAIQAQLENGLEA